MPFNYYSSKWVGNQAGSTVNMQVRRLTATSQPSLCPEPWG
jgi:hypothetical protein